MVYVSINNMVQSWNIKGMLNSESVFENNYGGVVRRNIVRKDGKLAVEKIVDVYKLDANGYLDKFVETVAVA